MVVNAKHIDGYILYIGAGRCSELQELIEASATRVILVDSSITVCNRLRYKTRNVDHISVVHAVVSGVAQEATVKTYNLEDLSGLHEAVGFKDIYPGLRLLGEERVQTSTLSDIIASHIPAEVRFNLWVDICGSEGSVMSELMSSSLFHRCSTIRCVSAELALFKGAMPTKDLRELFSMQGVSTTVEVTEGSEFLTICANIDLTLIKSREQQLQIKTLTEASISANKETKRLEFEVEKYKKQLKSSAAKNRSLTAKTKAAEKENKAFQLALEEAKKDLANAEGALAQNEKVLLGIKEREATLTASTLEHETLRTKYNKTKQTAKQNAILVKDLEEKVANLAEDAGEVSEHRTRTQALRTEVQTLTQALAEAENSISQKEDALQVAEDSIATLNARSNANSERLETVEMQRNNVTKSRDNLKSQVQSLTQALADARKEVSQKEDALQVAEDSIAALNARSNANSERLETVEMQRNNVTKSRDNLKSQVQSLSHSIAKLKTELLVANSAEGNSVDDVTARLKSSYETVVEGLEHQVEILTALSTSKSDQLNVLMKEFNWLIRNNLQRKSHIIDEVSVDIGSVQKGGELDEQKLSTTLYGGDSLLSKIETKLVNIRPAHPSVIRIGSVPRSGGTWVFNATRALLSALNLSFRSGWHADIERKDSVDYEIVKVHLVKDYTGPVWKTLTNNRPIEQRIASAIRMGWVEDKKSEIASSLMFHEKLYTQWKSLSDFEIQYEDILKRPKIVIAKIANTLGLSPTDAQLEKAFVFVNRLSAPDGDSRNKIHDPTTLLHPDHRNSDVRSHEMVVSRVAKIRDAMNSILEEGAS
ncbi:MAG: hypothetical protein ABJN22_14530 [Litorimonas sp.]